MPELAFISLGSNIEPEKYLPLAISQLHSLGSMLAVSNVYQNPAIASETQSDYLNAAVLIETQLQPLEIRTRLREIETHLDRVRTTDKFAARTIDLDLCLYGDLELEDPELTLPDPEILRRPHLALTLAELRPEQPYPGGGRKIQEIADGLMPGAVLSLRPDVHLIHEDMNPKEGQDD